MNSLSCSVQICFSCTMNWSISVLNVPKLYWLQSFVKDYAIFNIYIVIRGPHSRSDCCCVSMAVNLSCLDMNLPLQRRIVVLANCLLLAASLRELNISRRFLLLLSAKIEIKNKWAIVSSRHGINRTRDWADAHREGWVIHKVSSQTVGGCMSPFTSQRKFALIEEGVNISISTREMTHVLLEIEHIAYGKSTPFSHIPYVLRQSRVKERCKTLLMACTPVRY